MFVTDVSGLNNQEILLSVFQSTGGHSWNNSTNWLQQGVDVCQWSGVVCYPHNTSDAQRVGEIQELNFKNNNMVGTLPAEVFQIPYLEILNLDDNGDVSVDFSGLPAAQFLTELDLSNTNVGNLTGIEQGVNLQVLHLTGLGMKGSLPSGLFQLVNLQQFYANDNSFSGSISTKIGNMTELREIYLGNSDLTGQLPQELGSLTLLEVLVLTNNAFSGSLPQNAMSALTNLNTLAIQRDLYVPKGNGISGSVPAFAQHSQLTGLYLQNQKLSGSLDVDFLNSCPQGETVEVDLSSNSISGSVPASLHDITYLNLYLADNQITSVSSALISGSTCSSIRGWMDGDVGTIGCDAFLCPPGTWAPEGQATSGASCNSCSDDTTHWGRTTCASSTSANTTDTQVLTTLYNVMGGRSWKNDANWLSPGTSVCTWYGVTCTNGLVSAINLRNNGLSGTLPSELFSLPEIRSLDFELNMISLDFQGISSASNLEVLNLAGANLPASALANLQEMTSLKKLSVFSIDSNDLGGTIPSAVFSLTSLQELGLGQNGFTGKLDTSIGKLSLLQLLSIDGNDLTGQFPTEIGNLVNLQDLSAGENRFGGSLPTELQTLTKLQSLSLQQVVTAGGIGGHMLPFPDLGQLTSLQLGSNALTGTLPSILLANSRNLGNKITVDLSDNLLTGMVPSQWSRFDKLFVDLSANRITEIAPSLCQLSGWMDGDVASYGCDGILCPKGTSNSAGRQSDSASACNKCSNGGTKFLGAKSCSGKTPTYGQDDGTEAGILSDFFAATLGSTWKNNTGWVDSADICSFYGVVCDGSGHVLKIVLTDNGLQGTVPTTVFKLPQLNELILTNNIVAFNFSGIADAKTLTTLVLNYTNLDTIAGIGSAPNLATLDLADNNLKGAIPNELYLLSDLRELNLGYNQLSGKLPNLIGALTSLEVLRLYHNNFEGRIPAALADLTNLQELNMAENNFDGTIPPELNGLSNLRFLSLQREGGILGTNDIGSNQGDSSALGPGLTGTLPAFDKLPFISELYLGLNSLTGSIPYNFLDGVTDTSVAIKVDLMSNQLTGTVPGSLTQFNNMALYVADNQITDIAPALCSESNWMGGGIGQYQCNAMLCPAGTYNSLGRRTANTTCQTCSTGTNGYMGSVNCLTSAQQQESKEQVVLEKMFRQMNGENWLDNTNWMDPDMSICTWYGIDCDNKSSVITIDLENNRLLNTLVPEVYNLPNLQTLILKQNDISISLFGIENASNLEYLDVSETGLSSLAGISLAPGLKVLRADRNGLTSFPNDIYNMTNLETLALSDNPFPQMVIPDLHAFTNLSYLSLGNAGLVGIIPPWIGEFSNLEYLKLGQNGLLGNLPTALLDLMRLKYLDLSDQGSLTGGGLGGDLLDFSNQTVLSEIYLQNNNLQGTIPPTMLQEYNNKFPVTLDLRYNRLTGTIPTELAHISDMSIYLASNMFSTLPTALCNTNWNDGNTGTHGCDGILCAPGTFNAYGRAIGKLDCMKCNSAFMTATLGSTTCGTSLEHTALIDFYQSTGGPSWTSDNNWLNSQDHCTWEGVTCHADGAFKGMVQKIDLEDNNLVGNAYLAMIWRFEGLEYLNLQQNDIVVSFVNIENAVNLETIIISETKTNSLAAIGGAKQLKQLYISNAQISGQIPDELFNVTSLEQLHLSGNAFTGSLPSKIGQLTNLVEFYIFGNNIKGTLPTELGLLGKLVHLSLGNNEFVGEIPRQVGSLPRLEVLSLEKEEDVVTSGMFSSGGSPGLSGKLPALNGLPNIKEVYLGHNSFSGSIPSGFLQGVLDKSKMLIVDLSYNNLSGPIPSSFANFGNLVIELARNQISAIPGQVCAKTSWFNGEVANGCDAILCPPGTYNQYGRRVDTKLVCEQCTYPGSAVNYGSVNCGPVGGSTTMDARSILMELYDAAGGSEWYHSAGWNSQTVVFCKWYGITCEPQGQSGQMSVTEIALTDNNLIGDIPSILFFLPELRKLDVRNNDVSIGLNAVSQAKHIEELYLDKTSVYDLEGIGKATSLIALHLSGNSFGWNPIPDQLFDLTGLEDLYLSDSMFGGTLSTKIGQLTNLRRLNVVGNAISGQIPSEIGNLVAVQEVDLSNNDWDGTLPSEVMNMTSLKSFGITNDQIDQVGITGQLQPFDTMPSLQDLYLANNQFTGTIPDRFLGGVADKSSLITVYMNGNNLGGTVPSTLATFSKMDIYLENNLLTGFGTGICQQSQWMDGNVGIYGCNAILCPAGKYSAAGRQLSDSSACRSCPDLQSSKTLGSDFCLSVELSKERGILEKLFQVTAGNSWTHKDGWMDNSTSICNWYGVKCKPGSSVESILLGGNGLIGTIPTELYDFPNLKFLWLYSNAVDIGFEGIAQATSLTSLLIDSTKVSSLKGIGQGISLVNVDVRFNNLGGPIPAELSKLVNLESFTCSENDLTGMVPSLDGLRKLTTLRMSNNKLTGTLPSFAQHPSLVALDLSQNKLVGSIPSTMLASVAASAAIFLDLSTNSLTGTVPGELARFTDLTIFLRENRIEGINSNLCDMSQWNDGDVGRYKCDGILCPAGTFSPTGRASKTDQCMKCSKDKYLGSITCGGSSAAGRFAGALGLLASLVFATTGHLLLS